MADIASGMQVLPAPGFWHAQKPTSFICSSSSNDAGQALANLHAGERVTKRKPARGPSNPCDQRCRTCAYKLEFVWEGSSKPPEWVLVGPDTTYDEIHSWAASKWGIDAQLTVLLVGDQLVDIYKPIRELDLQSGSSPLFLGLTPVFDPQQQQAPMAIQQPALAVDPLLVDMAVKQPAEMAYPPPALQVNPQQAAMAFPPPAQEVNPLPALDADLLHDLAPIVQYNQQAAVEANPPPAIEANQQPAIEANQQPGPVADLMGEYDPNSFDGLMANVPVLDPESFDAWLANVSADSEGFGLGLANYAADPNAWFPPPLGSEEHTAASPTTVASEVLITPPLAVPEEVPADKPADTPLGEDDDLFGSEPEEEPTPRPANKRRRSASPAGAAKRVCLALPGRRAAK
ncbi:hypothetical protein MBLNU457_6316t1 [Dothideomycetes sp. NU457]